VPDRPRYLHRMWNVRTELPFRRYHLCGAGGAGIARLAACRRGQASGLRKSAWRLPKSSQIRISVKMPGRKVGDVVKMGEWGRQGNRIWIQTRPILSF
jgi:hypothetical protein